MNTESEVMDKLLKCFRQSWRGKHGSPGKVCNLQVKEDSEGLKLCWDQPNPAGPSKIRYRVYMLSIWYDSDVLDMVVKWRSVYFDDDTHVSLTSPVLDSAAVYVDPDDTAYHFVVFGTNCLGSGTAEYIKHKTE